tara:strand:- start:71 stop:331 length:261 start_codon:yes stop_codon:yes gene_type:complete
MVTLLMGRVVLVEQVFHLQLQVRLYYEVVEVVVVLRLALHSQPLLMAVGLAVRELQEIMLPEQQIRAGAVGAVDIVLMLVKLAVQA